MHVIGFAKAVGDITDGAKGVIAFFLIAFVITSLLLLWYTKSAKLTGVALVCALLPVLWLLGTLPLAGYGIDPLSILVPFLIFSIGCSHAVQMTNAWKDAIADGFDSTDASRFAFSQLFIPGTLALVTNALGFLVIMLIEIDIVRELGITATLGVSLMIVTNKMVLPILLTYLKVSQKTLDKKLALENSFDPFWARLLALRRKAHGGLGDRRQRGAAGDRFRAGPRSEGGRSRLRLAGTARGLALQPRQRRDHLELQDRRRRDFDRRPDQGHRRCLHRPPGDGRDGRLRVEDEERRWHRQRHLAAEHGQDRQRRLQRGGACAGACWPAIAMCWPRR